MIDIFINNRKLTKPAQKLARDAYKFGQLIIRAAHIRKQLFAFVGNIYNAKATIDSIVTVVCRYHRISPEKMRMNTRKGYIVEVRQICHYFAMISDEYTDNFIGKHIGNKDRCTVLYSCTIVKNRIETESTYRKKIMHLAKLLKS